MTTHPVLGLPFGLPLGLELYSVRDMLPKDYAGTLKKVAALGYRDVEAAGYFGHSPADVKAAMAAAGLRCVSAHYSSDLLSKTLDDIIAFHKVLGAEYILCSYPGHKNPPAKGAEHSFTRPGAELDGVAGISHHQLSDERSWRAMLDLFHEVFS